MFCLQLNWCLTRWNEACYSPLVLTCYSLKCILRSSLNHSEAAPLPKSMLDVDAKGCNFAYFPNGPSQHISADLQRLNLVWHINNAMPRFRDRLLWQLLPKEMNINEKINMSSYVPLSTRITFKKLSPRSLIIFSD